MPRIFTLVSIVVHAIAIAFVFVLQIFSVGPLPIPREVLAYDAPRIITDIVLPHLAPHPSAPQTAAASSPSAAPIESPHEVIPETGLEHATSTTLSAIDSLGPGVESGADALTSLSAIPGNPLPPP